jgi:hypothetical protein
MSIICSRSRHVGKLSGEILARGSVLEGLVGSDRIIVSLPGRTAGSTIESLDAAIELGGLERQHRVGNSPDLTGRLDLGLIPSLCPRCLPMWF